MTTPTPVALHTGSLVSAEPVPLPAQPGLFQTAADGLQVFDGLPRCSCDRIALWRVTKRLANGQRVAVPVCGECRWLHPLRTKDALGRTTELIEVAA